MFLTKQNLYVDLVPVASEDYGYEWELKTTVSLLVVLDKKSYDITILNGFITDGASASWFKAIISPLDRRWALAALIHDALYVLKQTTRKEADLIFLNIMSEAIRILYRNPLARFYQTTKALIAYHAVRQFGRWHWNRIKTEKEKKYIKVEVKGLVNDRKTS